MSSAGVAARVQSFLPPPILSHHPPPLPPFRSLRESSTKPHINPSVLVIVIILSVVFLCSGILHILARCLGRRRAREPANGLSSPSNSIRGQLQHLFSLHDSGVEQVFIDTLPVFLYGSIRGLKDSADCAVCLNEFANEDKLRLLPKCKHAFHTECIDTWLLSNSTCPLCRRSLLPEAEPVINNPGCTPQPEEQGTQPLQSAHGSFRGSFRASLRGSFRFLAEAIVPPPPPPPPPPVAMAPETLHPVLPVTPPMTPGPTVSVPQPDGSEKTLRVELGKVNNLDARRITRDVVGTTSSSTSQMPRSYSMGSYEYVVDFSSLGLGTIPGSSLKPTHRRNLSDGIPELSSAGQTPGQEDLFWARRGLDTPRSISRVREIMTPSPGWGENNNNNNYSAESFKKQKQVANLDHDEEDEQEIKLLSRSRNPNLHSNPHPNPHSSPHLNPHSNTHASIETEMVEAISSGRGGIRRPEEDYDEDESEERSLSVRLFRIEDHIEAMVSHPSPTQERGVAARKDKVWEVSVDVVEPSVDELSKKSSPLNWLRGRGRRLVYSAASPSSTTTDNLQSTEIPKHNNPT